MRITPILTVAAMALSAGGPVLRAASITDLYNTGVNDAGITLPGGASDPHYTLTSSPLGSGAAFVVDNAPHNNAPPIPPWVNDSTVGTPGTMWISGPNTPLTPNTSDLNGTYVYRTLFSIGAGFDHATASLAGVVTADDRVSIFLNGVSRFGPTDDGAFTTLLPFSIDGGFVPGVNSLEFRVENTFRAAQGLFVTIAGQVSAAPGPSSVVVLGSGLAGLIGLGARRMKEGA